MGLTRSRFAATPATRDSSPRQLLSVSGFYAVYYKPTNKPQLILRRRSDTDDHELLARAWQAANDKARELGWIV